jgi:polar amino acid transport system ATP-binding protein
VTGSDPIRPDAIQPGPVGTSATPVLEVRGLVKRYGAATVLDQVELSVAENQVVTLIGASGSGKSTLLRCVDLLEEIDDGRVFLDGTDIADPRADAAAARRRMSIVFQAFNLFPHMTAAGNVALAPRVVHGLTGEQATARAHELLDRVGLGAFAEAYPDRLSGGQQQRVAIARALAVRPRLLLLDEVTSALDPELVGEVLEIVRELARGTVTILMATHEMGFAKQVSDRVCFLDGGRVCEAGPPEQVLSDPVHERTRRFLARVVAAGRLS